MSEMYEFGYFQVLTPGLYSGDPIVLRINYEVINNSFWAYLPWALRFESKLDGHSSIGGDTAIGHVAHRDNVEMPFTGNMPVGKHLTGEVVIKAAQPRHPNPFYWTFREIGRENITVANLDDVVPPVPPPNGPPPAVCTEGQTRCDGYTLHECVGSKWVVKEYYSPECGWTPVPPEPPPPPPPDGDGVPGWFERNKVVIIAVAAVVLVIVIIVMIKKPQYRPPIKIRTPIVRK